MTGYEIETEALFYRLLYAYLLQKPSLKDDYNIILDQYQKHKESFKILHKHEVEWLGRIQKDIKSNKYTLFSGILDLSPVIPEILKKEKSDQNHKNLCREIIKRKDELLTPFTGSIDLISNEHPVVFGIVDIIVQSNRCIYAIEVKSSAADHSIIGQMMKYYIGLCLNLILKIYDEVKMISLCPGYDSITYNGLKQIGAIPLIISKNPLKISKIIF